MIVTVTGGIATGKSTVSKVLGKRLDIEIIDADIVCRDLLNKEKRGWQGVQEKWGDRFFDAAGQIDRVLLRRAIFSDTTIREELEQILHPLARMVINEKVLKNKELGKSLLVEIPLLYEVGWQKKFDLVVAVFATRNTCVKRIMNRDKVSERDAECVIDAQMPVVCKALLADSVIDNSGTWADTCLQVCHLAEYLRKIF